MYCDGVSLEQADGSPPIVLTAGSPPGESAVSVFHLRFKRSAHFSAMADRHIISFALTPARMEKRIEGRALLHQAVPGMMAIGPARTDYTCDAEGSFLESMVVAVDPALFSLAAADDWIYEAQLVERMSSLDGRLLDLARILVRESASAYAHGPLFWNEASDRFIDHLIDRHSSSPPPKTRGMLGAAVLRQVRSYIEDNLDQPISVVTLARLSGRSRFHFSRLFSRAVGVSPHRYIVHVRLQRALQLILQGRLSLAEIAQCTGFADQSHLSRWVRRTYGVSLSQVAAMGRESGLRATPPQAA